MSTQQEIYAAGSKNRPPMLNKENYVSWSSRLLRYAKSKPKEKLIYNSIMHDPYVKRMIPEPGDPDREVPIDETFHEQTDEELTEKELRAQQMMKGSDIEIQEKKAKLFNEWERFTSTDGESIESYYHHFLKLMNDFKRNKHFPENIASNLKFLNNLQPEWSRHVTIVHQIKDLHKVDYTQLYDFLKYNQVEVNELRAERLARAHDPLALMANSNNSYNYSVFHQDQPSQITYMQQPLPNNNFIPQPSFNTNYMQQLMPNPKDGTYADGQRNQVIQNAVQNSGVRNVGNQNGLIVVLGIAYQNVNQNGNGMGHLAKNCIVRSRRRDAAYLQTQLLIAQKEEACIQIQAKEFDLMAAAGDLDEIEEVNANCILMASLQQALTSGTQTDKAPVYYSDGSTQLHHYDNCYNNDIFNMFTQEKHMEHNGGIVERHPATVEETCAYFEPLYNNLAIEVEKVNFINRKMKETNAELTTELARL
ncbi:hypothetical protein Tco_1092830 [Tanacetum coccineum]|uniref:Gag-Pol polyprotein n=1 Tax=Tanacetum coccineum TaxID=301880 RepID=A0ABQ5IDE1_9ASTR